MNKTIFIKGHSSDWREATPRRAYDFITDMLSRASAIDHNNAEQLASFYNRRLKGITFDELEKIINHVYSQKDWEKDRSFSAYEGQQIEKSIYYEMHDCLPPLELPQSTARRTSGIIGGFLVGEPYGWNENGTTYEAFGYTADKKYYYLGLSNTTRDLKEPAYFL